MDYSTIIEIVRTVLSYALPVAAVPFLAKCVWRQISVSIWQRRLRKAGFSKKEIRKMLEKAFLAEITR